MYGLVFYPTGYNTLKFINCSNMIEHRHDLSGYNSTACGFTYESGVYLELENCVSNFTVVDYAYTNSSESGTTKYAVGRYISNGCTSTNFTSTWT